MKNICHIYIWEQHNSFNKFLFIQQYEKVCVAEVKPLDITILQLHSCLLMHSWDLISLYKDPFLTIIYI